MIQKTEAQRARDEANLKRSKALMGNKNAAKGADNPESAPETPEPVQILTDAIDAVANSEGVPAAAELLRVLDESRNWERRCVAYRDPSQSDKLMIAYAAALTKELTP